MTKYPMSGSVLNGKAHRGQTGKACLSFTMYKKNKKKFNKTLDKRATVCYYKHVERQTTKRKKDTTMMNTKMYYGWGTDNKGWVTKQYAKKASDLRKVGGHVEILVSKVDADGWCYCEWVRALVDLSKA